MLLFDRNDYVYTTSFEPEECIERLRRSTVPLSFFLALFPYFFEENDIPCLISGSKFNLYKHRLSRLPTEPVFYGRIEKDNGATVIVGRFRMRLSIKLFLFIGFMNFIYAIFSGSRAGYASSMISIAAIISFFFIIWLVGNWLGKKDREFVLDFLQRTLKLKKHGSAGNLYVISPN